jgi:hypothetical protein
MIQESFHAEEFNSSEKSNLQNVKWIWTIRKIVRYFSFSPEIAGMETLMETTGKKSIFSPLD